MTTTTSRWGAFRADEAVALVGANALARRNPLERHLRDVFCARIHTPQDDTIHTAAGRAALSRQEKEFTT